MSYYMYQLCTYFYLILWSFICSIKLFQMISSTIDYQTKTPRFHEHLEVTTTRLTKIFFSDFPGCSRGHWSEFQRCRNYTRGQSRTGENREQDRRLCVSALQGAVPRCLPTGTAQVPQNCTCGIQVRKDIFIIYM